VTTVGRRIEVRGIVQGVGFRPWIYKLAAAHHVTGRVRNNECGVIIDVFGPAPALNDFTRQLVHDPPAAAEIVDVASQPIEPESLDAFTIVPSTAGDELRVSIPPDLATCPESVAEFFE
jgi:hydrogenase maturation protein HypF